MAQAIILSGGKGTRLYPLTLTTPKPMLPIGGIPHLAYQIKLLKRHTIDDIIFSTGYLHKQIEDYFGDGSKFGVKIRYKEDGDIALGTGGAIKNCDDMITSDNVFVINGDILTDMNLSLFMLRHLESNVPISLALVGVEDPTQFGVARIKAGRIIEFIEKPPDDSFGNLINAGVYIMKKDVIKHSIPKGYSMVEKDLFPKYADLGMLGSMVIASYWLDIGTHERYELAQTDCKKIIL